MRQRRPDSPLNRPSPSLLRLATAKWTRAACLLVTCWLAPDHAPAAHLDQATLTEVVNQVSVLDPQTRQARPARKQDLFRAPEVLRTGARSRAELLAEDKTVTRIGAHTIFSFHPESREIDLEKGALLFHSPAGKGGGTIRTSAASAAVLGTTLIVSATRKGAMKVLLLEGKGRVLLPDGQRLTLHAGEMVTVLPGQYFSHVESFRLREQATQSLLVRGFRTPLASQPRIQDAMRVQQRRIDHGQLAPRHDKRRDPSQPRQDRLPPPPPGTRPPFPADGSLAPLRLPLPPPPRPGATATALDTQREQRPPPPPPPRPRPSGGQRPPR